MNSKSFKAFIPYLTAIVLFILISFVYFSPLLKNKVLSMHDANMASGGAKELSDYYQKTNETVWWTNSMFGGMPSFMITGRYPNSISSKIGPLITDLLPVPANMVFLLMLGFYVLMISLRSNNWIAIIGSIAYAFGTYNLLSIEAGHISKIIALAYGPALLGGFILIFRKQYLIGTLLTSLFLALELYANHLQITYYFFFVLLAYTIYESAKLIKAKDFRGLTLAGLCLFGSVLIGVGMNTMRLWNNIIYSQETIRGKSELTNSSAGKQGLDINYAFSWSYGLGETFNLLIPDLYGGGSGGSLPKSSETYKTLVAGGVDQSMASQFIKQLPLYTGTQPGTSGPSYSGIIIIFLFVLGLFIVKDKLKWVILGLVLFLLILSWGSNFSEINNILFQYLPGYNKFRAVTMSLHIVHFLLVWAAANTLIRLISNNSEINNLKKPLLYSCGIIFSLMIFGYLNADFQGQNDSNFKASLSQSLGNDFANRIVSALVEDRSSKALNDFLRGIMLVLISAGLVYTYSLKKINITIFNLAILLLVIFDFLSVDKRYFNNDDFVSKYELEDVFVPNSADLAILNDKDPDFRVVNLSTGFWSDARDSYFHKSIGGYHGAKLKKTQELYEFAMIKDGRLNIPVLDMLNTKYFINKDQSGNLVAQPNPGALGHSWFVDSLIVVDNADKEIEFIKNFNPGNTAVIQSKFGLQSSTFSPDSSDYISLTSYKPHQLMYKSKTSKDLFAVFSEIYYRGNKDWISYLDGKKTDHFQVDYVLRGMSIPAGEHEIKFEFRPESVEKGKYIDLIASVCLVLLAIGTLFFLSKKK